MAQHAPRPRPQPSSSPTRGAPGARAGRDRSKRPRWTRAQRQERRAALANQGPGRDHTRPNRSDRARPDRTEPDRGRSDRTEPDRRGGGPRGPEPTRTDRRGAGRAGGPPPLGRTEQRDGASQRGKHAGRKDGSSRAERTSRTDRARTKSAPPPRIPPLTGPNAFVDLGVPASLAAVLATQQITEPTPIQALMIPAALAGHDVLGRGRTGSGKTLAFGLPMLARLAGPRGMRRQPRGLVLAPTRELAMQVGDALRPLASAHGMRVQLVIGGASYDRQIRGLERADVVVATPGRLVDLAERGAVDLGTVQMVVLDEADHMADLGFMPEIEAIMSRLPGDAQGLLLSATLDADVDRLVRTYLRDPVEHSADPVAAAVGTMAHHLVLVHPRDKDAVTTDIARRRGRTLAFVRTQLGADRLAGELQSQGVRTAALHGGMKQRMRTRTLEQFRAGYIDVLVATDVAARGIHVDDIDLVLHVDPPHGPKEYLHRSGRTARAGASGTVVSLTTLRQQRMVHAITTKAGVAPAVLRARPGDDALRALVG